MFETEKWISYFVSHQFSFLDRRHKMFLKGQKNKLKWFVNWISWLLLLQGFHQKSRLWPQAYQCPLMCGSRVPRSSSRHSGSMQGRWLHSTARLDSGLTATLDSGHHGIPHVQNSKDKLTHLSALDWPRLVLRALCHSAAQPWHLQPVTTQLTPQLPAQGLCTQTQPELIQLCKSRWHHGSGLSHAS